MKTMSVYSNITAADTGAKAVLPWDNAHDPMSYEAFQRFNLISQCVTKPILFLIGIPSNIVNCVVFWRQGLRDRMNFCLFFLALADLLYLLSLLGTSQVGSFVELADELLGKEIYYKSLRYGLGIREEMRTMASCITLVISIERCVCVYLPLRATSLMKTRSMGALLASVYVITQLAFIYSFFEYEVTSRLSNITNQTYWVLEESAIHKSNYHLLRGLQAFMLTVLPQGIFITICIATAATVVQLRAAIVWRRKTSSSRTDDQQMALIKMLVVVSCAYIVTAIPYVGLNLTSAFVVDFDFGARFQNSFLTMAVFATICTAVSCSFNFIIYYRHSSRYKHEIKRMFCFEIPKLHEDFATGAVSYFTPSATIQL